MNLFEGNDELKQSYRKLRNEYATRMQQLLDEYGITEEAAVVSGHIVSLKRLTAMEKDDYSFYHTDKIVELRYLKIFNHFRSVFLRVSLNSSCGQKMRARTRKISAAACPDQFQSSVRAAEILWVRRCWVLSFLVGKDDNFSIFQEFGEEEDLYEIEADGRKVLKTSRIMYEKARRWYHIAYVDNRKSNRAPGPCKSFPWVVWDVLAAFKREMVRITVILDYIMPKNYSSSPAATLSNGKIQSPRFSKRKWSILFVAKLSSLNNSIRRYAIRAAW